MLVDTSVWINHFRRHDSAFARLLEAAAVLMHPFVLGELACGNFKNRDGVLSSLRQLPTAVSATHEETLQLIDRHKLWGRGIGWIDAHLLASALLSHCRFWTLDERLAQAANDVGV